MYLRILLVVTVVAFWISGWVPVGEAETYSLPIALIAFAALVQLGANRVAGRRWPEILLNQFANAALAFGILVSVLLHFLHTSASTSIWVFEIIGVFAYVKLLIAALRREGGLPARLGRYASLLVVLAVWSWISALALHTHRGVDLAGRESCVFRPYLSKYTLRFASI